ncbi:type VII secretion protein EccB [Nocardia puris]|uniref:Type VII secretion protein EccB n=1 Tax=Nocardia puris TaxID=208602 RepID=A0A366DFY1_9NOCA|nr:type VII secretion protein EccB [Nocardia puris]MBF6212545.1 type VII secretion protein EccB [Nocardia puris]MBF6366792.1 type VII secretion protein EccB [Nocardia puris]MBF6461133.1 type VII secretion protein EccB [Nocardia puris]RBO88906.1 type VII secretion protein EccB [Nocardia puris]
MPAQLTTRQQVNGYRFLLRRYEHALIRRDVRMLHDPMRSQSRSLIVGAVLGLLVVAGAAILSFLRPQGAVGDAKIVMAQETGALYAVVDDRLHPVLNLASARLITGTNEEPTSVKTSKLTDRPRGPLLGIPGAPGLLPGSSAGDRSTWTICDTVALSDAGRATANVKTTAIAGALDTDADYAARPLGGAETMLVTKGGKTYLLFDGRRAELDLGDPVLVRALGLAERTPRAISAGLLNATVEVPPLRSPAIDGVGGPGPGALSDVPVGGVIRVRTVASEDLYVVLPDGVQPVSPFAAELIRTSNSQEMTDIVAVPPDRLVGVPVRNTLPVDRFPREIPDIKSAEDAPVGCLSWSRGTDAPAAAVALLAGRELPLRDSAAPVELATADGGGDRIDAAYIPPGTGEYVQVTGIYPESERRGSLFYVAENGIRFGVPDPTTAALLGLEEKPRLAPWAIVGQLVPGTSLTRENALVSHDTLPTGLP